MKIKQTIPIITICLAMPTFSIAAHADKNLSKNYIVSEIWSDWWLGKGDDGNIFPEASYKHHVLEKWVNENYGNDAYEWSDIGELRYSFKDYYKDFTENWNFNDDDNGNWTIDTDETSYHFSLNNGKWLMIDSNGDTVDTFMPFSTLKKQEIEMPQDNNSSAHRVKEGFPQNGTVSGSDSISASNGKIENASESKLNGILYGIGALIVAGLVTIGIMLYRRKK